MARQIKPFPARGSLVLPLLVLFSIASIAGFRRILGRFASQDRKSNRYALEFTGNDFLELNETACHSINVPKTVRKARVRRPVFYISGKFHNGKKRWKNQLKRLGCRVLKSGSVERSNILIFGDELPMSLLHHPRYERHRWFLSNASDASTRGAGYWFWKPLIVLGVLKRKDVPDGSYIIYTDSDRPDVIGYAYNVIETMADRGHNFAIQQWEHLKEFEYTKGDTFHYFGLAENDEITNSSQFSANFFIVQKTPATVEFILNWAHLMEDYHLVSDEPSNLPNHPKFVNNRHDQSMLSILLKLVYNDGGTTKTEAAINMNNSYIVNNKVWTGLELMQTYTYRLVQNKSFSISMRNSYKNTKREQVQRTGGPSAVKKLASKKETWETLRQNADAKIAERRAWLSIEHSEHEQFGQLEGVEMWYMFLPVLPCLWSFDKTPSSTTLHDGGKWLCGLEEVHTLRSASSSGRIFGVGNHYDRKCIVYSVGSSNEFSFESRVRTVAPGCEIHTFDPTVSETGDGKAYYDAYHGNYGLAGQDSATNYRFPVKSLPIIMKELEHTYVDYLKVDVEGFEWEFFETANWEEMKVGQILVELHPGKFKSPTAKDMNVVFNKLEQAGFYLISLEPVTYSNFGQVELVFLHSDWLPEGMPDI